MTTVLLPVKYNAVKTLHFRDLFAGTKPQPPRLAIVVDDDPAIVEALGRPLPWEVIIPLSVHSGFWKAVNVALNHLSIELDEPIIYVGNDVAMGPLWLIEAERCYRATMPDGLGLLTFKDGIQNGFSAAHGMTTRAWLSVLNGIPYFWPEYFQYYHDSEMSDRSKELGRFFYCEESLVLHEHDGAVTYDSGSDKLLKDHRDREWILFERERAQERLAAARGA